MATATTRLDQAQLLVALPNPSPEAPHCAICLESTSQIAVLQPCRHDCFDFDCLKTWLATCNLCPLCKQQVTEVHHDFDASGECQIVSVSPVNPPAHDPLPTYSPSNQWQRSGRPRRRPRDLTENEELVPGLESRCYVYRNQLFSLHVGSNPASGYAELTSESFRNNEILMQKAKKWIRRELQVFRFPESEEGSLSRRSQRASHTEFLLGYIVSIMTFLDLKGGRAEDLVAEYLGRNYARLFLHELAAWMRSPCRSLVEYDRRVQYDIR